MQISTQSYIEYLYATFGKNRNIGVVSESVRAFLVWSLKTEENTSLDNLNKQKYGNKLLGKLHGNIGKLTR